MDSTWFHGIKLPEGSRLRRKEVFEYTTPTHTFDVEMYESQEPTWYAIAVPREAERLMVFGTRELNTPEAAMKSLIDKIRREENLIDPDADTVDSTMDTFDFDEDAQDSD